MLEIYSKYPEWFVFMEKRIFATYQLFKKKYRNSLFTNGFGAS
jgi:hypothetical protein